MPFTLKADYQPCGDQPQAIDALIRGLADGTRDQVLLGITGSGKTFTVASTIDRTQRPTLVIAHNKTLAAQLYQEFKSLFPENAVEYFVSYYDYYQPEAYVPASDTYIEKDAIGNEEIDPLRMSATRALFERRDVIVVASVSCIYGLGDPDAYYGMLVFLEPGMAVPRAPAKLSQVAVRDAAQHAQTRHQIDQTGIGVVGAKTDRGGQARRSAAPASAHNVRHGDDERDGVLSRD